MPSVPPPASVSAGTQTIGKGDAEALTVHDPGGVPASEAMDVSGGPVPAAVATVAPVSAPDADPKVDEDLQFDTFSGLFGDDHPNETESLDTDPAEPELEAGATEPVRGVDLEPTPEAAAAPAGVTRPDWMPEEIDHHSLSEAEAVRLRLVHEQAATASQLPADEAALLQRYREASAGTATARPAVAAPPQDYQPRTIEIPDGYEGDAAIAGLVSGANQQAAESAYLHNQNNRAIHELRSEQAATSQRTEQSSQLADWNNFVTQHPEAADPAIQEKMGRQINFYRDPNTTMRQLWADSLAANLPAATPPPTAAPMDPRERINRGRRAAAAVAANPAPATARQPARREIDVADLHDRGASFSEFHEHLHS